jgi:hypothetical protein
VPPPARSVVLAPTLLAAVFAAAYLLWPNPPGQDLAAAEFRADLFAREGFELCSAAWYSGFELLSYSVLFPPLGALLGPRLAAALAVVAAAALFALLAERRFGRRALLPALWFAAAAAAWLLTGRMPFLVALPFGLAALLASERPGAPAIATGGALAALTALVSPVAGLFVAIAGAGLGFAGQRARGAALALGGLVPVGVLSLAYPTGGEQPFAFSAFVFIPAAVAVVLWLVPREQQALRIGALVYLAVALVALLIPSPLGGNVTRLGALFAGPVLALVLWPRGRWVVAAVCLPLAYWGLVAPARDVAEGSGLAANERHFYEPLIAELKRVAEPGQRIQIPPTRNRWEAAYVAPVQPLARGWLRQLEASDIELFTEDNLAAGSYRAWLDDHGVAYVALADTELDYLAEDEAELIEAGLPYLEPVWENPDWRLYAVSGAPAVSETSSSCSS